MNAFFVFALLFFLLMFFILLVYVAGVFSVSCTFGILVMRIVAGCGLLEWKTAVFNSSVYAGLFL